MFNISEILRNVNSIDPFADEFYQHPICDDGPTLGNLEEFENAPTESLDEWRDNVGWSFAYQSAYEESLKEPTLLAFEADLLNMRNKCSIVNYEGTTYVHWIDSKGGWQFQKICEFHNYNNRMRHWITITDAKGKTRKTEVSVTKEFMKDMFVKQYEGVEFNPGQGSPLFLNYWKGWSRTGAQGDMTPFHDLLGALCADCPKSIEYLMNYLAHMVQKPETKPEVAVVMRGPQGIGKGTLMNLIRGLLNGNFKHLSSTNSLTGQFSGHLIDAFVVFADEAVWGGNKEAEGRLKAMITEKQVSIRALHKNEVYVDNFVRLFVASNENWVVPVGEGDRRYFVLDCDPRYKGQTGKDQFFGKLNHWYANGGAEALFYELKTRDISEFNPRVFPITQARIDMQKRSLGPITEFIYYLLLNQVEFSENTVSFDKNKERQYVRTKLYQDYVEWAKFTGHKYPGSQEEFSKELAKCLSFKEKCPNWTTTWKKSGDGANRPYVYKISSYDEGMESFAKVIFNSDAEKVFATYKAE